MRIPSEAEFESIRAMSRERRLFVDRWTELFDSKVPYRWRLRPLPWALFQKELESVVVEEGARKLSGGITYAQLLDEEWEQQPKTMFEIWPAAAVEMHPLSMAEQVANCLSFAGFHHKTLFEALHLFLDGRDLQSQLNDLCQWHSLRMTPRKFEVMAPVAHGRNMPSYIGLTLQQIEDTRFKGEFEYAVARKHVRPADRALSCLVDTHDPNAAWQLFLEEYDKYLLLLRKEKPRNELADGAAVFVFDPFRDRMNHFQPPPRYQYQKPDWLPERQISRATKAAAKDGRIGILLERYLQAVRAAQDDNIREAFQALTPVLDIGFDCDVKPWADIRSGFIRTLDLAPLLAAVTYPHALFDYITTYLRLAPWPNGGRRAITGSDDYEVLATLLYDVLWEPISRTYNWAPLVDVRRNEIVALAADPRQKMADIWRIARWDVGRLIRARHAFAHRGEPLVDSYLLALLLDLTYSCLALRCSAAESDLSFGELIYAFHIFAQGVPCFSVETLILSDPWSLAAAVDKEILRRWLPDDGSTVAKEPDGTDVLSGSLGQQ